MWSTEIMELENRHTQSSFFSKVDVPDHAHYIIALFVFVIGTLGITGNVLVMFAFYRWVCVRNQWILTEHTKVIRLYLPILFLMWAFF